MSVVFAVIVATVFYVFISNNIPSTTFPFTDELILSTGNMIGLTIFVFFIALIPLFLSIMRRGSPPQTSGKTKVFFGVLLLLYGISGIGISLPQPMFDISLRLISIVIALFFIYSGYTSWNTK